MINTLGEKIRRLRKEKKQTLDKLCRTHWVQQKLHLGAGE